LLAMHVKVECPSTPDKVQYDSAEQAAAYAELWAAVKADSKRQEPYFCPGCAYWHLRSSKAKRKNKVGSVKRRKKQLRLLLDVWEGEGGSWV